MLSKIERIKELLKEAYELYNELFELEKEEIHKFLNKLNENNQ
jgi:DNA-binding transcriptional regulator GbsR (MarR family)